MALLSPLPHHIPIKLVGRRDPTHSVFPRFRTAIRSSQHKGLQLITRLRKNMKNQLMHLSDKLLLRKRAIIESIIDQLKNISQIEHSRHRSPTNFVVHLIAGLIAYTHQEKKPGLHLRERALLAA